MSSNVDLLKSEPEVAIKKLMIPIMVSMLITSLYNVVDGIWISGIGIDAIAGIGFVTPLFMLLNGISSGLVNSVTSVISRFIGAGDQEKIDRVGIHALIIFAITSMVIIIFTLIILKPYLSLGLSGESFKEGMKYAVPLFSCFFVLLFVDGFVGILNGEGDTKRTMCVVISGVILNAILDPIFIYILNLGSSGAACATILSAASNLTIFIYWIFIKNDTYLKFNIKNFKFDLDIFKTILEVGIPASIDMIVLNIAGITFITIVSIVSGDFGVAIYNVGYRLYLLGLMPLRAIGITMVIVVGSVYGAKNSEYMARAHKFGCKVGLLWGIVIYLILCIFAYPLSCVFLGNCDDNIIQGLVTFLQVATLFLIAMGIGMPSSYFYQGIGKSTYTLLWTFIREIIFTLICVYVFGIYLNWGLIGIWVGLALGRVIASILNFIFARFTIESIHKRFTEGKIDIYCENSINLSNYLSQFINKIYSLVPTLNRF